MVDSDVRIDVPEDLQNVFASCEVIIPEDRARLIDLALGEGDDPVFEVGYDVPGKGRVVEATVTRCRNGASVNYMDPYMRRRDPDCMVVADSGETDKERYDERYSEDFSPLRSESLQWLAAQKRLIVMPFMAGDPRFGYEALIVAPANAGFFVGGLADLQSFIPKADVRPGFRPQAVIYVVPPFRHTHFDGRQVVVHNRLNGMHELFSYNLYPGPSAKKGVYGILLHIGETEGWVTLHSSTVKVVTPYDNEFVIMHEGASGGGKSEMIQELQRQPDGRLLIGESIVTGERIYLKLSDTCELHPVTDDMALCHPKLQHEGGKLVTVDAEAGWFLRVDHLTEYGTEPHLEKLCTHPPEPLIFLNLDGKPGATCLLWEHTMDEPGKPCPNPRVIMPRRFVPNVISDPIEVDVRSFGVRTPPCTKENPNYGILGLVHILPPAIAWLWRLVAPRGHANPSIVDTSGLSSEGVGSYWPFATGRVVTQANILLEQMIATPKTRYKMMPNQHVGAYKVGFMPEWIAREYFSRRGSVRFRPDLVVPSRLPLLGYALKRIRIEGSELPPGLLRVNEQLAVGNDAYDAGARILVSFFKRELAKYRSDDLHPVGQRIIQACMDDASLQDYVDLLPGMMD